MPKWLVGFISATLAGIIGLACGAFLTKSSREEKEAAILDVREEAEASIAALEADIMKAKTEAERAKNNTRQITTQRPRQTRKQDTEAKPRQESQATKKTIPIYKMNETVTVGYTSYYVWDFEWKNEINLSFGKEIPNATYLIIDITARNDDKKPRTIPSFRLIDENGSEYEDTFVVGVNQQMGTLDSLNPTVSQRGKILFDIPRNHRYYLKVSGGFWSNDNALIQIIP